MIADERRALAMAGGWAGRRAVSGSPKPRSSSSRVHSSPRTQLRDGPGAMVSVRRLASLRARRGLSSLASRAIERATRLVLDICGGEAGPVLEAVRHRTCRCLRCVCVPHWSARCSASS